MPWCEYHRFVNRSANMIVFKRDVLKNKSLKYIIKSSGLRIEP